MKKQKNRLLILWLASRLFCSESYEVQLHRLQADCKDNSLTVIHGKALQNLFYKYNGPEPLHIKLGFVGPHYTDCKMLAKDIANITRWLQTSPSEMRTNGQEPENRSLPE